MRLPFAFAPISHNAFPPSYPPAWIVDLRSGHPRLIAAFSDSLRRLPRVRVWKWGIPASRRCTARATPSIGDSIPLPLSRLSSSGNGTLSLLLPLLLRLPLPRQLLRLGDLIEGHLGSHTISIIYDHIHMLSLNSR